jgi:PadR family transcriptional regulator, regulatory protein PadR
VSPGTTQASDPRWESQLRKGTLDLAILAILWDHRRYGLEIIRALRDGAGVEIAEGTLYPILMRLTQEGLLQSEWVDADSGHQRKYYRLTATGSQRALEMMRGWDSFTAAMSNLIKPMRRSSKNGTSGSKHA